MWLVGTEAAKKLSLSYPHDLNLVWGSGGEQLDKKKLKVVQTSLKHRHK